MEKKLPSVFANKIEKNIDNNEKVFYSKLNDRNDTLETPKNNNSSVLNINQKINNLFNSTQYVYKINVRVYQGDNYIDCKLIGKNATHLITIENKLIPISSITDVELLK